ncbi:hypothetical protein F5Y16DRAFT_401403 [Xylariaceae sp. FL0255]|nr:hypothetical protein F5Y16DRAFT_401403 [Xylariaceae sp. FL0255]
MSIRTNKSKPVLNLHLDAGCGRGHSLVKYSYDLKLEETVLILVFPIITRIFAMSSEFRNYDPPSFEIALVETGDEGSGFRTQNDPSAPLQRRNIVERPGVIDVRCTSASVVHGHIDGQRPASLMIYDFQFDTRKHARRIKSVDIKISFTSEYDDELEVKKISNKGRMSLNRITQKETITKGGEANAGFSVSGAQLGGNWKWEKTVNREVTDAVRIYGSIDLPEGRNYGCSTVARWTIMENALLKEGVPAFVRTAVLLARGRGDEEFCGSFEIRSEINMAGKLDFGRVFGKTPKDDPVRYDPTLPPENTLVDCDIKSLGSIDIQSLGQATMTNYEVSDS